MYPMIIDLIAKTPFEIKSNIKLAKQKNKISLNPQLSPPLLPLPWACHSNLLLLQTRLALVVSLHLAVTCSSFLNGTRFIYVYGRSVCGRNVCGRNCGFGSFCYSMLHLRPLLYLFYLCSLYYLYLSPSSPTSSFF